MPAQLFQLITISADLIIFIFVGYYLIRLAKKEKVLEKKEEAIDTNYHQVVDNALSRERKILEDATEEADHIITGAEHITHTSHEVVKKALQDMLLEVQQEAGDMTHELTATYATSLKQLTSESLADFQQISRELEDDLRTQIKHFRETLLPNLEKELEEYKQARLKEIEQTVLHIVQKASEEIFNKTLSITDHQHIILDSLEKAKKEGMFD